MREKLGQQKRSNGQLFIVHPLWMANYAAALGIRDDDVIATVLLHDVCEDTLTKIEALPFNETIRKGMKYMTFRKYENEEKQSVKRRYFNELLLPVMKEGKEKWPEMSDYFFVMRANIRAVKDNGNKHDKRKSEKIWQTDKCVYCAVA